MSKTPPRTESDAEKLAVLRKSVESVHDSEYTRCLLSSGDAHFLLRKLSEAEVENKRLQEELDEIRALFHGGRLSTSELDRLRAPSADAQNGARPLPFDRDTLGRMVREAWVRWAETQPSPKPSWLVPYDDLDEADKEADRQIGEAIARWVLIGDAARAGAPSADADAHEQADRIASRYVAWDAGHGAEKRKALSCDVAAALLVRERAAYLRAADLCAARAIALQDIETGWRFVISEKGSQIDVWLEAEQAIRALAGSTPERTETKP